MNKIKIAIVDDSQQMKNIIDTYFKNNDKYEVVLESGDGASAFDEIKEKMPDIVLLDLILPNKDGFGVLAQLQTLDDIKVIVTSALTGDNFVHKAMQLGANDYVVKPFVVENLEEHIQNVLSHNIQKTDKVQERIDTLVGNYARQTITNRNMEERISNIFITVGIPAHIKGYQFLREAIKMAIDEPEIVNSITKKLYPNIAQKFNTSASKVERAIRHAIEVAWNRGKIENINSIFGLHVYNGNEKPTNGEFIALVADKMIIEGV